jgi:hypothetical protein
VHRPHVAGIHGRSNDGAYSLVLAGGYEDDVVSTAPLMLPTMTDGWIRSPGWLWVACQDSFLYHSTQSPHWYPPSALARGARSLSQSVSVTLVRSNSVPRQQEQRHLWFISARERDATRYNLKHKNKS